MKHIALHGTMKYDIAQLMATRYKARHTEAYKSIICDAGMTYS